jgi:drug/metabolite transporter (DMT)-like permease
MRLPARWSTVCLFLCAPLLFAGNMVVARAMSGTLAPATLALGRWTVAAALLLPLVWPCLRRVSLDRATMTTLAWLAVLGGALSVAPQYAAAAYTSAGHIALVFAATPLVVALIERAVWKVPLGKGFLAGVTLACLGIGVAAFKGDVGLALRLDLNRGDLLALAAAVAWATYTAILRHRSVHLPPLALLWIVAAGGAASLLPFAVVEWSLGMVPVANARSVGGVLFLAMVASIGAYLVYGRVVEVIGAAKASTSMYLVPVYALALGVLFLNEGLRPYHFVAVALVLVGVVTATLKPSLAPASAIR